MSATVTGKALLMERPKPEKCGSRNRHERRRIPHVLTVFCFEFRLFVNYVGGGTGGGSVEADTVSTEGFGVRSSLGPFHVVILRCPRTFWNIYIRSTFAGGDRIQEKKEKKNLQRKARTSAAWPGRQDFGDGLCHATIHFWQNGRRLVRRLTHMAITGGDTQLNECYNIIPFLYLKVRVTF